MNIQYTYILVPCRESSLEWVELKEVWRWASSVVVCSLCSWRHILRLLTESFNTFKSSLNEVMSFFTSALNSIMLPYIDLTTVFRLIRFASMFPSIPAEENKIKIILLQ